MANLGFTFDPNEVPEDEHGGFDLIPGGTTATMAIVKTEVTHKDADGNKLDPDQADFAVSSRMAYEAKILDGKYQGRPVWGGMNFRHPNQQAQQIGQQEMACAFTVTGNPPSDDSEVLHDIPFSGFVKIAKNKRTGEERNEINWRRCKPVPAAPAPQRQAAQTQQRQPAPTQQRQPTPAQQRQAQPAQQAEASNLPWTNRRRSA
jgi:hypothetical protein